MNLQKVKEKVDRLAHWIQMDSELPVLYWYISALKPGETYLEIGTGATACSSIFAALSAADGVNIHTVDYCAPWVVSRGVSVEEFARRIRVYFDEYGLGERIVFHVTESVEMDWDGSIHVLFIDGAHDTSSVKADIEKWTPFVPVGGVVLLHDCVPCSGHPLTSIKRAVDELMRTDDTWEELDGGGSLCVFRRAK